MLAPVFIGVRGAKKKLLGMDLVIYDSGGTILLVISSVPYRLADTPITEFLKREYIYFDLKRLCVDSGINPDDTPIFISPQYMREYHI